jgi:hypothetical protein
LPRDSSGKPPARLAACGTLVKKPNGIDEGPVLGTDELMLAA